MEALYLLIPLSVLIVAVALAAFFAMSDGGQFDDMKGPALRLLQDDDRAGEVAAAADASEAPPGRRP